MFRLIVTLTLALAASGYATAAGDGETEALSLWSRARAWGGKHEQLLLVLSALSLVTFVGSLAVIRVLIVRMPADYFSERALPQDRWIASHPAIRLSVLVAKNVLGFVLVLIGIVLSLPGVPGQGILTILIGITLMNFPGKRRLELGIVGLAPARRAIDWLRVRNGRPPLERAGDSPSAKSVN